MSGLTKKIDYIGPSVIPDNEISFINELASICQYSDPGYTAKLVRKEDEYIMHITPGDMNLRQCIIDNLLHINRQKKMMLKFSSSLKISKIISLFISPRNISLLHKTTTYGTSNRNGIQI